MSRSKMVLYGCETGEVIMLLSGLGFVLTKHESEQEEFIASGHKKTKEWWYLQAGTVHVTVCWEGDEVAGVIKNGYLTVTVTEHPTQ